MKRIFIKSAALAALGGSLALLSACSPTPPPPGPGSPRWVCSYLQVQTGQIYRRMAFHRYRARQNALWKCRSQRNGRCVFRFCRGI